MAGLLILSPTLNQIPFFLLFILGRYLLLKSFFLFYIVLRLKYWFLLGGGQPWTMSAYLEEDPRGRDIAFLDNYATERWETVLHYMVASSQQAGISQVRRLA